MKKYKLIKKQKKLEELQDQNFKTAYDFAVKAYKQFNEVIKTIVLFGSVAKDKTKSSSDIDIIIIVDDCTIQWDQELIAWYREELTRLTAKQPYAKKLHLNTITLSTFWEELKAGEPVVINVIRYGQILLDFGGFFEPLKVLLAKGKIRPTPEAIFTNLRRAYEHSFKANHLILSSIEGYYWSMVDTAQAALMALNEIPPSPEHISEMLEEHFVKKGMLGRKNIDYFNEIRIIAKKVLIGEIKSFNGKQIDEIREKSRFFVTNLSRISEQLIKNNKIIKAKFKKI